MIDIPLALLPQYATIRFEDGTTKKTTYATWRHLHNTGRVKTYRNTGHFRMVSASELERLATVPQRYGFKTGVIHIET